MSSQSRWIPRRRLSRRDSMTQSTTPDYLSLDAPGRPRLRRARSRAGHREQARTRLRRRARAYFASTATRIAARPIAQMVCGVACTGDVTSRRRHAAHLRDGTQVFRPRARCRRRDWRRPRIKPLCDVEDTGWSQQFDIGCGHAYLAIQIAGERWRATAAARSPSSVRWRAIARAEPDRYGVSKAALPPTSCAARAPSTRGEACVSTVWRQLTVRTPGADVRLDEEASGTPSRRSSRSGVPQRRPRSRAAVVSSPPTRAAHDRPDDRVDVAPGVMTPLPDVTFGPAPQPHAMTMLIGMVGPHTQEKIREPVRPPP